MEVLKSTGLVLFAFFLFVPSIHAFGISANRHIRYSPGMNTHYDFCLVNEEGAPERVRINVTGALAKYITLGVNSTVTIGGGRTCFPYTLNFPEKEGLYGTQEARIVVTQAPEQEVLPNSGMRFNIILRANHRIIVDFPYPGKYVELSVVSKDVKKGQPIVTRVRAVNRGTDIINSLKMSAKLELNNKVKGEYEGEEFTNVKSGEEKSSIFKFTNTDDAGVYLLTGSAVYDGKKSSAETTVRVGTKSVVAGSYEENATELKISPFWVVLKNMWNEKMSAYAEVTIYNDTARTSFKTFPVDINGFASKKSKGYIDASSLMSGNYRIRINVFFDGGNTTKEGAFTLLPIKQKKKGVAISTTALIIAFAVLLVIINLFIILRRKREHGK